MTLIKFSMPQMRHLLKGAAYLRLAFGIIIFAFKITESMSFDFDYIRAL